MNCEACPVKPLGLPCPAITRPHPRFCELHQMDPGTWGPALIELASEPPPLPSLAHQVVNFAAAQIRHALDGRAKLDAGQTAARLAVCETCDQFRSADRRCAAAGCGCFVDLKATYRSERCPLGRWPELPIRPDPAAP